MEYVDDGTGTWERTCSTESTSPVAGYPCGLGLVYSELTLTCGSLCSDYVSGCSLCSYDSSTTQCTLCDSELYSPSSFTNVFGETYSYCTTDLCVDCPDTATITNCAVYSNFGDSGAVCKACDSGYYVDGTVCTQITGTETRSYTVSATTGLTFTAATIDIDDTTDGTDFFFI